MIVANWLIHNLTKSPYSNQNILIPTFRFWLQRDIDGQKNEKKTKLQTANLVKCKKAVGMDGAVPTGDWANNRFSVIFHAGRIFFHANKFRIKKSVIKSEFWALGFFS